MPLNGSEQSVRRMVCDLQSGDRLEDDIFLIVQRELRSSSAGSFYIHAVFADRSGQIVGRMWNASQELFASLPEGGLVHVCGRVDMYKGRPQLIFDAIRAVDVATFDPREFLPSSPHDVEQMWQRTLEILRMVKQPALLALLGKFIKDEGFASRFKLAPAARTNHHAYLGGLLEHTLNLLELAVLVLPRYPRVDPDIVLAGIFFHDCGKTAELTYETGFGYSDEGQMLGHITIANLWIERAAAEIAAETGKAFPRDVLLALQHVIVAHHGKYEFGSPRLPATAEAFMVHYLDNLDAKLAMVFGAIDNDADASNPWTSWIPALENRIFKGK